MKKKILTLVLSAVLCLGMSVSAFAATSPSASNGSASKDPSLVTTKTSTGATVTQKAVTQSDLNATQKQILGTYFTAMSDIDKDTSLTATQKNERKATAVQTMINSVLGVNYSYEAGVYGTYELTASDLSNPIPVTVAGVEAGDTVVVAHLTASGVWENVTVTDVADGTVYAKFNSLSPVFIAVVKGSGATSPKTADAGMNMVLILFVVAVAGGAVYAKRRMSYVK